MASGSEYEEPSSPQRHDDDHGSVHSNNDSDDGGDANLGTHVQQTPAAEAVQPQVKRGRGRPPKRKDLTEANEVKGLPKKLEIGHIGDALNKAVLKDLAQLPLRFDLAEAYVQKENIGKEIKSLEHVVRHLPEPETSDFFAEEDWDEVQRKWRRDPLRKRKLNVGSNDDMVTLYKMCLAHLRCLPEDIICRHNYLEYNGCDNRINKETREPSLVWSATFCELLAGLILHPLFQGSVGLLATAMQYTVITISGDRNPWLFRTEAWDTFPSCVQEESRNGKPRKMCDIRLRVVEKNSSLPQSQWNILFQRIETIAALEKYSGEPKLTDAERTANDPYMVHSLHLEMLTKALDTMGPTGYPMFQPISILRVGVDGRRSVGSYPKKEDLEKLRNYAIPRQMAFDLVFSRRVKSKEPRPPQQSSRAATMAPGPRNVRESKEPRPPQQSSRAATMAPGPRNVRESKESRPPPQSSRAATMASELARPPSTAKPVKEKLVPRRSARISVAPSNNLATSSKAGSTTSPKPSTAGAGSDSDVEPGKKRRRSSNLKTRQHPDPLDGEGAEDEPDGHGSPPPVKRKRLSKSQTQKVRNLSESEDESSDEDSNDEDLQTLVKPQRMSKNLAVSAAAPTKHKLRVEITPTADTNPSDFLRVDDGDDEVHNLSEPEDESSLREQSHSGNGHSSDNDPQPLVKPQRVSNIRQSPVRPRFSWGQEKRQDKRAHSELIEKIPAPNPKTLESQLFSLDPGHHDDPIADYEDSGLPLPDNDDSALSHPKEISGSSNSHQTSAKANQRTLDAESSCSEDFEGPEMGNRSKMPTGGPYLPWPEDFDTSRLLELAKFPRPMADDWE